MLEENVAEQVQDYLEELGYPKYLLSSGVRTEYGERVDVVVYEKGTPHIIVEVKSEPGFPKAKDADSLRFDSSVRQAQAHATSLNAPYYLLTNGSSFLWFTTDEMPSRMLCSHAA